VSAGDVGLGLGADGRGELDGAGSPSGPGAASDMPVSDVEEVAVPRAGLLEGVQVAVVVLVRDAKAVRVLDVEAVEGMVDWPGDWPGLLEDVSEVEREGVPEAGL
jgi:hypothetical protein